MKLIYLQDILDELRQMYHDRGTNDKDVLIIGHRITQYGLDHFINGKSLEELVATPFKWQPGWTYKLG